MQRASKRITLAVTAILVAIFLTFGYMMHYGIEEPRDVFAVDAKEAFGQLQTWSKSGSTGAKSGSTGSQSGSSHSSREFEPPSETLCQVHTDFAEHFLPPLHTTDWSDLSYNTTVNCPVMDINNYPKPRNKVSLDCSGTTPYLSLSLTHDTSDIYQVTSNDPCLGAFIDHCCTDDKAVQNVAHHVLFGNKEFGFFQFLSFMSVVRFMKPCVHLIHGDYIPSGPYWNYFISHVPNVIHVQSTPPTEVYGHKLAYPEHRADVLRIDVVNKYGGVYTDWDMILLKPLEPLRQYDCTMSELLEPEYIGCAFIMAKKDSNFVTRWKEGYKEYQPAWGYNSQKVPYLLSQKYPDIIHVEGHNFFNPGMQITFVKNYDVTPNYGLHLAIRYYKDKIDLNVIRKLNTLMGAACRHILLGNKDICA